MHHDTLSLSTEHHRRGGLELKGALYSLRAWPREYPGRDVPAYLHERIANLREFLDRFPRLQYSSAWHHRQLVGKMPRLGEGYFRRLPGEDHTSFWRVRGVRGPILATTFPYHWSEETHAEAAEFARLHGLVLEVRPPDVPDFYYPGATVPIVWSRASVDWRSLAAGEPDPPPAPAHTIT